MAPKVCEDCLVLIKEFEGLRLEAYPDPGSGGEPWTLGYGHTKGVTKGDVITKDAAEQFLLDDLTFFEQGVSDLFTDLTCGQYCALVSFAFNVGLGALSRSTLCKRLQAGEDTQTVLSEELPRWVNGANGPMAGLIRRRDAEIEFAAANSCSSVPENQVEHGSLSTPGEIRLEDFFQFYNGSSHQLYAVGLLEEAMRHAGLLNETHPWVRAYRDPLSASPTRPQSDSSTFRQLDVPYLFQFDSETDHGGRMCFSSANAMLLEYLRPGELRGSQEDDVFLDRVFQYGDTTSAQAQINALLSFGLRASFRTDGDPSVIKSLINKGIPVPCGILHHCHSTTPCGGGHWVLIVGYDDLDREWVVHDPAGCLNESDGGYLSQTMTAGRFVRYSYEHFNRRWMIEGGSDGWFIEAEK